MDQKLGHLENWPMGSQINIFIGLVFNIEFEKRVPSTCNTREHAIEATSAGVKLPSTERKTAHQEI